MALLFLSPYTRKQAPNHALKFLGHFENFVLFEDENILLKKGMGS